MSAMGLMLLGVILIIIGIGGLAYFLANELFDSDPLIVVGFTLALMATLGGGLACCFGAVDVAGEKIETKTEIVPDTLVFSKNGVADTTYVYNRPAEK